MDNYHCRISSWKSIRDETFVNDYSLIGCFLFSRFIQIVIIISSPLLIRFINSQLHIVYVQCNIYSYIVKVQYRTENNKTQKVKLLKLNVTIKFPIVVCWKRLPRIPRISKFNTNVRKPPHQLQPEHDFSWPCHAIMCMSEEYKTRPTKALLISLKYVLSWIWWRSP